MLDEGIYGLSYRAPDASEDETGGDGLAVLRNGRILGSDRWGGVLVGRCERDAEREVDRVRVRLEMPPGGVLVTGYCAGPEGATLDIVGVVERPAPRSATVVEVAGRPVAVELTYLGPLPA